MSTLKKEVRNMLVNKDKNSDFLEFIRENEFLKDSILRIFPSGNYYIYTFKITSSVQPTEIKKIQDNWI